MKRGDIVKVQTKNSGVVDGYVTQVNTEAIPGVAAPYAAVVYPYHVADQSVPEGWAEHFFDLTTGNRYLAVNTGAFYPALFPAPSRLLIDQGVTEHIHTGDTLH